MRKGELESSKMKCFSTYISILTLYLALSACRPVIAIGWPELVVLVVIIALLLGPLMFRLYRFLDKVRKVSQAEEKNKQK